MNLKLGYSRCDGMYNTFGKSFTSVGNGKKLNLFSKSKLIDSFSLVEVVAVVVVVVGGAGAVRGLK